MTEPIKLLEVVALTEDLPERDLRRGQVGTVVEELAPDVFEVEFNDNQGRTYAMLAMANTPIPMTMKLLVITPKIPATTAVINNRAWRLLIYLLYPF